MNELKKQKIVFLDRDGTICTDRGAFHAKIFDYKNVLDNIEPIKGCKEALKKLKDNGYVLVVISNQAGVAKGKFKESDIHKFNNILNMMLGNIIDGFYYCIHHKNGKDRNGVLSENAIKELLLDCGCRKPKTGMFLKCKEDLKNGYIQYIDEEILNSDYAYKKDRKIYKKNVSPCEIDIEHSYMIGDKKVDLVSGKNFDLKTILVRTGEGEEELKKHNKMMQYRDYDYIADDINDAINHILNEERKNTKNEKDKILDDFRSRLILYIIFSIIVTYVLFFRTIENLDTIISNIIIFIVWIILLIYKLCIQKKGKI